jgi:hypothetical protein
MSTLINLTMTRRKTMPMMLLTMTMRMIEHTNSVQRLEGRWGQSPKQQENSKHQKAMSEDVNESFYFSSKWQEDKRRNILA